MNIFNKPLLAVSIAALLGSTAADACTGLIVGKQISANGSVMIARNEDFGVNNWNKHLAYRAAKEAVEVANRWVTGEMPPIEA